MNLRHAALFILIFVLAAQPALAESAPTPLPTMPVLPTRPPLTDASAVPDNPVLYYNPDGGIYYHLNPRCARIREVYLPLRGSFLFSELVDEPYRHFKACVFCGAPARPALPEATPTPVPTPTPIPVWENGLPVESYVRKNPLDMPAGDEYYTVDFAVATFRGNSFRTNAAAGRLEESPTGLSHLWTAETGRNAGTADGSFRWWSQPAIIKCPKELRELATSLPEEARDTSALKEVIFASADGHIYFLNLSTGAATRETIRTGYPMAGAVTLHPLGFPLLIAGQSTGTMLHVRGHVGLSFYETVGNRLIRFIDGQKELPAMRADPTLEGAFNTSALIDRTTDTAVALSSDGWLFTGKLGSRFNLAETKNDTYVNFSFPQTAAAKVSDAPVTAAMVMYGNRLWFGTTAGEIVCVDTTTMQPLWKADHDGMLHALAMDQDADGQLWLYAATSWYSYGTHSNQAPRQLLRVNADNGETDWAVPLCLTLSNRKGGAYAPPVVGEKALKQLVYFNVTGAAKDGSGAILIALDKQTGAVAWTHVLSRATQTAPVAVYTPDGSGYIIMLDEDRSNTTVRLLDGLTGKLISTLNVPGGNCSSPAVYGDTLVFGATDPADNCGLIHAVRLTSDPVPAETQPAPDSPFVSAAAFIQAWRDADRDAMLALCAPSWKAAQTDPTKALFLLMANRVPEAFIIMVDSSATVPVYAEIGTPASGQAAWYLFRLRAVQEEGRWWIFPDALSAPEKLDGPPALSPSFQLPDDH